MMISFVTWMKLWIWKRLYTTHREWIALCVENQPERLDTQDTKRLSFVFGISNSGFYFAGIQHKQLCEIKWDFTDTHSNCWILTHFNLGLLKQVEWNICTWFNLSFKAVDRVFRGKPAHCCHCNPVHTRMHTKLKLLLHSAKKKTTK